MIGLAGRGIDLYLSNDGSNDSNCTSEKNACASWDRIVDVIESGDVVNIDSGSYNISSMLHVDAYYGKYSMHDSENYTIIGNGAIGSEKTILEIEYDVYRFLYFDMYSSYSGFIDSHIKVYDFEYSTQSDYTEFGYFYYVDSFEFSNMVFDTIDTTSYNLSTYDWLYVYHMDSLIGKNCVFYDFRLSWCCSTYLFDLNYVNDISLTDIVVTTDGAFTYNMGYLSLAYFGNTNYGVIVLDNIQISNYYFSGGFYFDDCDYSNISLNNINMYNIKGGIIFYFKNGYSFDAKLNNIYIDHDGNDNNFHGRLLCQVYSYFTNLNIENSVFKNVRFIYSPFYFASEYYGYSSVIFDNVMFVNMRTSSSYNGLIYIADSYNVYFDNCIFSNNEKFPAMIQCGGYSYCNVEITNSQFINNVGYWSQENLTTYNAIILESGAYATLVIKDSCFEGGYTVWYQNDSSVSMCNITYLSIAPSTTSVAEPGRHQNNNRSFASKYLPIICTLAAIVLCIVLCGVFYRKKKEHQARNTEQERADFDTNINGAKHGQIQNPIDNNTNNSIEASATTEGHPSRRHQHVDPYKLALKGSSTTNNYGNYETPGLTDENATHAAHTTGGTCDTRTHVHDIGTHNTDTDGEQTLPKQVNIELEKVKSISSIRDTTTLGDVVDHDSCDRNDDDIGIVYRNDEGQA